jgi:S-DNA-T family DNA segregation ATPase FtsK/SpoIIIE
MYDSAFFSYGGFLGDYIKNIIPEALNTFWCNFGLVLLIILLTYICFGLNMSQWKKVWHVLSRLMSFIKLLCQKIVAKLIIRNGKIVESNDHPKVRPIRKVRKVVPIPEERTALPSIELLHKVPETSANISLHEADFKEGKDKLNTVLKDYGVYGDIINYNIGPVVTLYEFEPQPGTKSSRVISLADDISRSMCAKSTRIAVMPGKNALGIEIPNKKRALVYLRALIESEEYNNTSASLPIILGKDIAGNAVVEDLTKMPHLLVAGTTGSGKSVGINTLILSLLYSRTPAQCRLIMIDPKMLELSVYNDIPHLLSPVVTDAKKAVGALKWVVQEMENRYRAMAAVGVRNIDGYNELMQKSAKKNIREHSSDRANEGKDAENSELPHIVVIVDEMADLMLVAGKEIEGYIQRIAQMARASGIHLVMATQRPSVDVITGVIKANFPSRISFHVTSKIDSRTILGEQGAEQLLGMGDMLCMTTGGIIKRVHGPFVSDNEVEKVVSELKSGKDVDYEIDLNLVETEDVIAEIDGEGDLYQQAVQVVVTENRPTTSYLQRRFKIGYNKAASLIERMETEGIISLPNSQGKREVLQK